MTYSPTDVQNWYSTRFCRENALPSFEPFLTQATKVALAGFDKNRFKQIIPAEYQGMLNEAISALKSCNADNRLSLAKTWNFIEKNGSDRKMIPIGLVAISQLNIEPKVMRNETNLLVDETYQALCAEYKNNLPKTSAKENVQPPKQKPAPKTEETKPVKKKKRGFFGAIFSGIKWFFGLFFGIFKSKKQK